MDPYEHSRGYWRLGTAYPLAVGRAWRQLALGDDVALVDADEEP